MVAAFNSEQFQDSADHLRPPTRAPRRWGGQHRDASPAPGVPPARITFSMPDVDEARLLALAEKNRFHSSYRANLLFTLRAIGRRMCLLKQPGFLTAAQMNDLLLGIWSPNTVDRHRKQLCDLRLLVRIKRRYYLRNFHRCNATADEMDARRAADRVRGREKKRGQRARKRQEQPKLQVKTQIV